MDSEQTAVVSKSAVLIVAIYLVYKTCSPPQRSTSGDKIERTSFLNRNAMRLTPFIILWLTAPLLLEAIPTFLTLQPNTLPALCPNYATNDLSTLHFILASAWMIIGSSIRLWCYQTLGKFFTFEVTIRPEHRLITSGPYSFCRHPSYSGAFIICFGAVLLMWSPVGALATCGFTASFGVRIVRAIWTLYLVMFVVALIGRSCEGQIQAPSTCLLEGPFETPSVGIDMYTFR